MAPAKFDAAGKCIPDFDEWLCDRCTKKHGGRLFWVWAKKAPCPGKGGEGGCGCGKPKNAILFGETKAGKAVAAANKKGGGGNGNGNGDSSEVKTFKADLQKAQEALKTDNAIVSTSR